MKKEYDVNYKQHLKKAVYMKDLFWQKKEAGTEVIYSPLTAIKVI